MLWPWRAVSYEADAVIPSQIHSSGVMKPGWARISTPISIALRFVRGHRSTTVSRGRRRGRLRACGRGSPAAQSSPGDVGQLDAGEDPHLQDVLQALTFETWMMTNSTLVKST
jgi:hypothetical protein